MNEKLRIKVIGVFLVISLVWAGFNYLPKESAQAVESAQTIKPLDPNAMTKKYSNNFIDVSKLDTMSFGRSPFYMSSLSTINAEHTNYSPQNTNSLSWILSGIIFNNNSQTAIINKRPVKVGNTIDKAIVTKIEKEKVTIKYNKEEITLTISKG